MNWLKKHMIPITHFPFQYKYYLFIAVCLAWQETVYIYSLSGNITHCSFKFGKVLI